MKKSTILVAAAMLLSAVAFAADSYDAALVERIKAVGEVCKAGSQCDASAPAAPAAGGVKASGRSGADVVGQYCTMCHGTPGIPGAPHSAADWKTRLDAKGLDGLVASATKGINAMPPKGMCMDCSDAELKAAIQHMSK